MLLRNRRPKTLAILTGDIRTGRFVRTRTFFNLSQIAGPDSAFRSKCWYILQMKSDKAFITVAKTVQMYSRNLQRRFYLN